MTLDLDAPRRVGRLWVFPDGKTLPVVSGGDGPDDGDTDDADEDGDSGGDSETDDDADGNDDSGDGDVDVSRWKKLSRQNEREAKKLRKELEKLRTANLSAEQRAIEEAKESGRAEARAEAVGLLVAAKLEAALAGSGLDVDDIVESVNTAKFIDDDGNVDAAAVAAFAKKLTGGGKPREKVDVGQGTRGKPSDNKKQLTRGDLARMTPEQIVEADDAGRLADIKAGRV